MQDFLFYLSLGWEHIISLDALDHELFILALVAVFSFKEYKQVLILVTAFTIGHSLTLALSVLDYFRIPSQWVEFLIPCTILLTASENILSPKIQKTHFIYQYIAALLFGLIHGMGFANSVRIMLYSEQNIAIPLLGFNIGLEIGQILCVSMALTMYYLFSKRLTTSPKTWVYVTNFPILLISLKLAVERFPH